MTAAATVLEARDLVAGYLPEVDILTGCNLELRGGELVGVIGPNGAGKSTLLKAIFGLLAVRRGSVRLDGAEVTGTAPHSMVAKGMSYVPQLENVFPRLTVEENLKMGVFQTPRTFEDSLARVVEIFPLLGERLKQRAGALSGGERQTLALGRALMSEPHVMLLDEPSAGLSPIAQDDAFERIVRVNEAGLSVVIVEQNARRCLEISDRGYVLDDGQNAYAGSGEKLLHDPKVIDLYLGTLAASAESDEPR